MGGAFPSRRDLATPAAEEDFREAALAGLRQPRKAVPPKYLYDAAGSALFDRICELEEYYPTRSESEVLEARAAEIARRAGENVELIEFGAGSGVKVRILLDALERPRAYLPIDISGEHLLSASEQLAEAYPEVEVVPLVADFTQPLALPRVDGAAGAAAREPNRLGFFPGSTIGNFEPAGARRFLAGAGETLGEGAGLVLGVDMKKDPRILNAAYNDSEGVTAAFNLNLLARMNRELDATFDLERFAHRAFYNEAEGRIEMHIESLADQRVSVAGETVVFGRGETIHTENSYKYAPRAFARLAESAGWRAESCWTDAQALFSVWYLRRSDA